MLYVTIACVVAAAVALGGVLALHISCRESLNRATTLQASLTSLEARLRALETRSNETSNATLAAAVDDLRGAHDALSASCRKQFGKVWGTLGNAEQSRPASNGAFPPLPGWQQ